MQKQHNPLSSLWRRQPRIKVAVRRDFFVKSLLHL